MLSSLIPLTGIRMGTGAHVNLKDDEPDSEFRMSPRVWYHPTIELLRTVSQKDFRICRGQVSLRSKTDITGKQPLVGYPEAAFCATFQTGKFRHPGEYRKGNRSAPLGPIRRRSGRRPVRL